MPLRSRLHAARFRSYPLSFPMNNWTKRAILSSINLKNLDKRRGLLKEWRRKCFIQRLRIFHQFQ
jgi:hypothetical protein